MYIQGRETEWVISPDGSTRWQRMELEPASMTSMGLGDIAFTLTLALSLKGEGI